MLSKRRARNVAKIILWSAADDLSRMTGDLREDEALVVAQALQELANELICSMSEAAYQRAEQDLRDIRINDDF